MIYALVGTQAHIRKKALTEFAALGAPSHHLYQEHASTLPSLIDASSLFGEQLVVYCSSLHELASSKELLVEHLPKMQDSATIFIIDEPFGDTHVYNRLAKVSKVIVDAREEKIKDNSVFSLCDAFALRDKKTAWSLFIILRDKAEGEAIAGALWWKFQTIWMKTLEGKKTGFSEEECQYFGRKLLLAPLLAHQGKKDLLVELESIILHL